MHQPLEWCWIGGQSSGVHAEGGQSTAVEALLRFDSKAAALVLEEEVREAFFGSISSAIGGAPAQSARPLLRLGHDAGSSTSHP